MSETIGIYIYDQIGSFWGVMASDVASAIEDAGEDLNRIELYINSPGGAITEGAAIMTLLRRVKARGVTVVAYIDGLAASMASAIAMMADEIHIAQGTGWLMIHDPGGGLFGQLADFKKYIAILEMMKRNLVAIYSMRTKKKPEEISELMAAETWYDADTAVAEGFATHLVPLLDDDQDAVNMAPHGRGLEPFDLSCFANVPTELAFGSIPAAVERGIVPRRLDLDAWRAQDKSQFVVSAGPIRDSFFDSLAGNLLRKQPPAPDPPNRTEEDHMDPRIQAALRSVGLIDAETTKDGMTRALHAWFAAQGRDVPSSTDETIKAIKAGPQFTVPEGSVLLTEGELALQIDTAVSEASEKHADEMQAAIKTTEDATMARVRDVLGRCKMAGLEIDKATDMIDLSLEAAKDELIKVLVAKNKPVGPGEPPDNGDDQDAKYKEEYKAAGGQSELGCTLEEYIDSRRRDASGGRFPSASRN